jgi:hypothetical protein
MSQIANNIAPPETEAPLPPSYQPASPIFPMDPVVSETPWKIMKLDDKRLVLRKTVNNLTYTFVPETKFIHAENGATIYAPPPTPDIVATYVKEYRTIPETTLEEMYPDYQYDRKICAFFTHHKDTILYRFGHRVNQNPF